MFDPPMRRSRRKTNPRETWVQSLSEGDFFALMRNLAGNDHFQRCPAIYLKELLEFAINRAEANVDGLMDDTYKMIIAIAAVYVMKCQANVEFSLTKLEFELDVYKRLNPQLAAWEQGVTYFQHVCAQYASWRHKLTRNTPTGKARTHPDVVATEQPAVQEPGSSAMSKMDREPSTIPISNPGEMLGKITVSRVAS